MNAGADNAKPSGRAGAAGADIRGSRYIVEVDPCAVLCRDNALCTQDHAVLVCIFQCLQRIGDLLLGILLCRLYAPAGEHFICMVVMVMLVIVVMIVTAAGAVLVVFLVVVMMVFMLVVVIVVMAAAGAVLVMLMFMLVVIMIVMMVVVMLCRLSQQFLEFVIQGVLLGHCLYQLLAGELIPVCGDDRRFFVAGTQTAHAVIQLILRQTAVWLRIRQLAYVIWLLKNSPKFF